MSPADETDDPRRRLLIKALAAGLFSTAFPGKGAGADSFFGSTPTKLPPGQSIYRINGSATVNGKEASLTTAIGPNDTIETAQNSEIVFVVGGHSMILRGGSHLALQGGQEGLGKFIINGLRLLTGKLLSVSRNQPMRVQSVTATIGIRGTGFYIESDPELTYFCTCYGTTDVMATNDPESKDQVVSKHHDKPLYIMSNAQPGKNIRRAEFKNHTDQELMLIETLVGRTPPFVFPGNDYNAPRRDY